MGFELGIIFAFCAMLFWGVGDFMIQKNVRKEGNVASLLFIGIIGLVGLLPFVWKDISSLAYLPNLFLIILLGVLTFFAAMLDFEALKQGKISIVEVALEIELPIVIFLAIIFYKETLTLFQWLAVSLIFIGIILISIKKVHLRNPIKFLEKGVLIGLVGSVFMGSVDFLTAASARTISPLMAVWGPAFVYSVLCLIVLWKRRGFGDLKKYALKFKYIILLMGIFDTLAWVTYALATSSSEIGIITAITESYPAICIFLGVWINKEKVNWHQYLGAGLALTASVILGFLL